MHNDDRLTMDVWEARLQEALEEEHPDCDDSHCDIGFAMRQGYYLHAAFLLTGATDCPQTEQVWAEMNQYFLDLLGDEDTRLLIDSVHWQQSEKMWQEPHWHCDACNAYNWTELSSDTCGNCLAKRPVLVEVKFTLTDRTVAQAKELGYEEPQQIAALAAVGLQRLLKDWPADLADEGQLLNHINAAETIIGTTSPAEITV